MDSSSKPTRQVAIADHIWEAFEQMARAMGSDRDALINQAMFMFARMNGFLEAVDGVSDRKAPLRPSPPAEAAAVSAPVLSPMAPKPREEPAVPPAPPPGWGPQNVENDPVRREVAERVLETAAELERMIKSKSGARSPVAEEISLGSCGKPGETAPSEAERGLYLITEAGGMDRIEKDRFLIGRGKHCDLVINSGKVSREHAVIFREGEEYFIEDLGSSNGTWFNKQRIKRRKVEDGDEYFVCSDKIKLVRR